MIRRTKIVALIFFLFALGTGRSVRDTMKLVNGRAWQRGTRFIFSHFSRLAQ